MEFRPLGKETSPFCRTKWLHIHINKDSILSPECSAYWLRWLESLPQMRVPFVTVRKGPNLEIPFCAQPCSARFLVPSSCSYSYPVRWPLARHTGPGWSQSSPVTQLKISLCSRTLRPMLYSYAQLAQWRWPPWRRSHLRIIIASSLSSSGR